MKINKEMLEDYLAVISSHKLHAYCLHHSMVSACENEVGDFLNETAKKMKIDATFKVSDGVIDVFWGDKKPRSGTFLGRLYRGYSEVKKTGEPLEISLMDMPPSNAHSSIRDLRRRYSIHGVNFKTKRGTLTISPEKKQ